MYFDIYYLILVGPFIALSFLASFFVKSTFSKYSKRPSQKGITGERAARYVLDRNDCSAVSICGVSGSLTDHYNPQNNTLNLSEPVYNSSSISAIAVACHEAGHAVQKRTKYFPLVFRSTLVPVANIGSRFSPILIIAGFILGNMNPVLFNLVYAGIILFALAVLFYLITLPVEFNASRRALQMIRDNNILTDDEIKGARAVLTAAAMTYVASALVAMANLLRFILMSSSRRRR